MVLLACGTESSSVARAPFGTAPGGDTVSVYTLKNAHGMELRVLDYGGIILSLTVPDRSGRSADVVLGFDSLADYVRASPYFGAIIGRYGNRVAHGRFTLDGRTYTLARNNGPNHLHGGVKGFDKVVWDVSPFKRPDSTGLTFHYTSPDGEEGYPGTLRATVTYTLTEANELIFDYQATTDHATPVNLTQHSYFNLTGDGPGKGDILGHVVTINADRFTPVDSTLIPTGELRSVQGTPFDFRMPTAIGARIAQADQQLRYGGGYDHNFVLNRTGGAGGAISHSPPACTSRRAAVCWRSLLQSRGCSSTRATSSTARCMANVASSTGIAPASPWRRSTSPIPRTTRCSPRRFSCRAPSTTPAPCCGSRRAERWCEAATMQRPAL